MQDTVDRLINSYHQKLTVRLENAPLFGQVADLYYQLGKFDEALSACKQALQLQSNLASAVLILKKLQALGKIQITTDLVTPNSSLKNWISIDAESVRDYPDGINQIYRGELNLMLIKKVFSEAEIFNAKTRIEKKNHEGLAHHRFGEILGFSRLQPGFNKETFFKESLPFREELNQIFGIDFEARIEKILTKISGGRNVEIPAENPNGVYIPATVRIFHPNKVDILPVHTDNEHFEMHQVSCAHLNQIAKLQDSLSYLIVIEKPEKGGELVLYDLLWEQTPQTLKEQFDTAVRARHLEQLNKKYLAPNPGDMVIFNAGRIWHKVSDIQGKKNRITVGGFMSISKDNEKVFYWE